MKISDLLVKTYGNQSEVARILRVQRGTIRKLINLSEDRHIITQDANGDYHLYTRIGDNV